MMMGLVFILGGCTTKPMALEKIWPEEPQKAQQRMTEQSGKYEMMVIEGKGVDGIIFGDDKVKLQMLWGQPESTTEEYDEELGENVEIIQYTQRGIITTVAKSTQKVAGSFLLDQNYRGQTLMGVQLGDDYAKVVKLYGNPEQEGPGDWKHYASKGISFEFMGQLGSQKIIRIEIKSAKRG
jgi:hypothetical protein